MGNVYGYDVTDYLLAVKCIQHSAEQWLSLANVSQHVLAVGAKNGRYQPGRICRDSTRIHRICGADTEGIRSHALLIL